MSHAATTHHHADGHVHAEQPHVAARRQLDLSRLVPQSGFGLTIAGLFMLVGLACIAVTAMIGFGVIGAGDPSMAKAVKTHAIGSYHTGFLYVLGMGLGCLGLQMILQQFNAGWSATVRRQAENVASLMWVPLLLFLPVAIIEMTSHGYLFKWMNPGYVANDPLYAKKAGFLNPEFWAIRSGVYFLVWIVLGTWLYRLSRKQDDTGDRWLTAKARWVSSWGLLLFALTTAFASFDWLMGLDYHFFSTMYGVYFFAGSMVAGLSLLIIVLACLRMSGRLGPVFTAEHQHDLGKLLLAFTIFWSYVSFCQYFLIWYSNIPEETAYYVHRNDGGYQPIFTLLCLGHFLAPFVILLFRKTKRSAPLLMGVALWMLLMHAADLYYMVRPQVKGVPIDSNLVLDVLGMLGPILLFVGLVVWKVGRAPLTPIKDPRLHEVIEHKNYV